MGFNIEDELVIGLLADGEVVVAIGGRRGGV